jgi:virulence factor Mce-like protein
MSTLAAFIRRVLPGFVILAVLAVGVWFLFLRGGDPLPKYKVELDNAFGLTQDSEFRVAGVTVGTVSKLEVSRRTARAILTVEVERSDFGDLRVDAECSVEPQSVIGEYFMDCQPGKGRRLREGATIPVEQTTGTIPPDLVASVMRRPQREQFGIILTELGAGFATRGPELQQVIQRAIPALQETNQVLEILADNRRTLVTLNRDASTVLTALAGNRRNVGRFVREARDTAQISANRQRELRETIRLLPAFLRELRPTLRDLSTVAERQTPALRDLRIAAPQLTQLANRLGPFAEASGPALDALGEASKIGQTAVEPATKTLQTARRLGAELKDPATNLRFILEHIDDRDNAVEPTPVAPDPSKGLTGLEAFLRYPYVQAQAINLFDSRGYTLKLNALINECSQYTNAESAREDRGRTERCNAWLGPNQIGVTTRDPTESGDGDGESEENEEEGGSPLPELPGAPSLPTPSLPGLPSLPTRSAGDARAAQRSTAAQRRSTPRRTTRKRPAAKGAARKPAAAAPAPSRQATDQAASELLDYLLGS